MTTNKPQEQTSKDENLSIQLQELLSKYDINDRDFVKMLELIDQEKLKAQIEEVELIPNIGYISSVGTRREPNKQYKTKRLAELKSKLRKDK
jgi:hypothetical protein